MLSRPDIEAQQRMHAVDLSPAMERRLQLCGLTESAQLRVRQLYTPDHTARVTLAKLQGSVNDLLALCRKYGQSDAETSPIVQCANRVQALTEEWAQAVPKMSTDYYLQPIRAAMSRILSELQPTKTKVSNASR